MGNVSRAKIYRAWTSNWNYIKTCTSDRNLYNLQHSLTHVLQSVKFYETGDWATLETWALCCLVRANVVIVVMRRGVAALNAVDSSFRSSEPWLMEVLVRDINRNFNTARIQKSLHENAQWKGKSLFEENATVDKVKSGV